MGEGGAVLPFLELLEAMMEGVCLALHPGFQLGTDPALWTPWPITGTINFCCFAK